MKKNFLALGGVALLLLASCGPRVHRYGCRGGGRCITSVTTQAEKIKKMPPKQAAFSKTATKAIASKPA